MSARRLQVPVLMYHYLGDPPELNDRPYYVSSSEFERQMRFLRRGGYRTIAVPELVAGLRGDKTLPSRSVVITFDDGHRSFYEHGFPVLADLGMTATMFLITGNVGQSEFLGWDQIREMRTAGISFESHSHTHPILTRLSLADAEREVVDSKRILEEKLGEVIRVFAYRGGHFNQQVKDLVRQAGYAAAVCSKAELNTPETDRYELRRMGVRGADNLRRFARKVTGDQLSSGTLAILKHYLRM